MKRIIAMMLALLLLLALTACGSNAGEKEESTESEAAAASQTEAEKKQEEKLPQTSNVPVTLEALMKEPETAGDQFEFFGTESLCVDTYNGTKTMVVIPNEHESLPVTSMDGYLFGGESIVEAIRLNDNITTIQELR